MNDEKKIINKTEELLSEIGMNLSQLISFLGNKKARVLNLDEENYKKFAEIYEKLSLKKYHKNDKGRLLEELTQILFQKGCINLFHCLRNCRTSTNEIDMLIEWTQQARLMGLNTAFSCFGDSFLCECKNYKKKVDVTYVGKFASLLLVTGTKLGIMLSWEGITSRGDWSDSKGLIKKIALKDNIYIVVIDKTDLKEIYEKRNNVFSIVFNKYISLKNEIDYSKYIKKHECEEQMRVGE